MNLNVNRSQDLKHQGSHVRSGKSRVHKLSNLCDLIRHAHDDQEHKFNIHEEVAKIEHTLNQGIREERQSYNSRFAIFSKLKMDPHHRRIQDCGKTKSKSIAKPQSFHQKSSEGLEEDRKRKRKEEQEEKIIHEQSVKLNLMASGVEEFDNSRKRNLVEHIIFAKMKNKEKKTENEGRKSFQPSSEETKLIQLALEQKEEKIRKLSQLLSHTKQKQQLGVYEREPHSPAKPQQKLSRNQMERMSKSIEAKFKRATDFRKCEFNQQMKQIYEQIKNKEKVLNNYFKQVGSQFQFPGKQNIFAKEKGNSRRCMSKFNTPRGVSSLKQSPEKKGIDSGTIPVRFLNNIQHFYSSSREMTQNLEAKNMKLNANLIRPSAVQFSDQKIAQESRILKSTDRNFFNRKDLRICQKITILELQRKNAEDQKRKTPKACQPTFPQGRPKGQKFFSKIIQYF